jgi:hypothetical protein
MTKRVPHTTGCFVCGKPNANRRGLCQTHYKRFTAKLASFANADDADAFEQRCIASGWVSPLTVGGRPRVDDDPFDEIAANVLSQVSNKSVPQIPGTRITTAEELADAERDAAEVESPIVAPVGRKKKTSAMPAAEVKKQLTKPAETKATKHKRG